MYPSVAAAWPAVCRAHEGVTTYMYLDTKGLVTTGVGFLIDTVAAAQALPWLTPYGEKATPAQIDLEWREVKALQSWRAYNGLAARWRDRAVLHLTDVDIDALLAQMTPRYWAGVVKSAPNVEQAPADAQLALLDLAWQNGPAFLEGWPDTRAAVRTGDWARVAVLLASFLPKTAARTGWRVLRFSKAALVLAVKADPSMLWLDRTPTPAQPSTPALPPVTPPPAPEVPPVAAVKWSKSSRWGGKQYRKWRGGNMTPTGIAVCEAIPSTVRIMQGGLSTSVNASANTHAGLGAYDVSIAGMSKSEALELCSELIRSGECAFPRGKAYGSNFDPHIHVASNNDYWSLHPEAQAQVRDFKKNPRRDGLAYHRRYVGPSTPLGSWKTSPYNPANLKAPAQKQYRVVAKELLGLDVDRRPKSGKNLKKGAVVGAQMLVRRWGRWNVRAAHGVYYAVADSKQTYLEPIVPTLAPTTKKAA